MAFKNKSNMKSPSTTTTKTSTSSSSTTNTNKSVTFASNVRAKKTLHVNSYTMKEIHDTWYDSDDLNRIRQRVKVAANAESRGSSLSELRGLEAWTTKGLDRINKRRSKARKLVVKEQTKQGTEELAEMYQRFCLASSVEARMMGHMDEKEMKQELENEMEALRRKNSNKTQETTTSTLLLPTAALFKDSIKMVSSVVLPVTNPLLVINNNKSRQSICNPVA